MSIKEALSQEEYNRYVTHPVQTWQWGEFRKQTGLTIKRFLFSNKAVTVTFHPLPYMPWTVGYIPRGPFLNLQELTELKKACRPERVLFFRMEPDVFEVHREEVTEPVEAPSIAVMSRQWNDAGLRPGKERFTPWSFLLNLSPDEEILMNNCHKKTRYNIRLAGRKGVEIRTSTSEESLETFCRLMKETTDRQGFYSHGYDYFKAMYDHLVKDEMMWFLEAVYKEEVITSWILFQKGDRLYYPYGASSHKYKEVMANNLIMWTAIQQGKERECRDFDMWGCMGPEPDEKDAWYGFHRFKKSYNPDLIHFLGTWDAVVSPLGYRIFNALDSLRWRYLRWRKR